MPYTPGAKIPDSFILYQSIVILLSAFNTLSVQGFFQTPAVRNIPDTYSCVINKLSPAANVKASAATKQTSATIKQIHTTTMWKPITTKPLPAVNMQAPAATKKMFTATVQPPATTKQIHANTMWKPVTTKTLPAVNVQASAAAKQIHTVITQKPTTTKLLPAANTQTLTAIKQMPTTLASPTDKPSSNQAPMSQPVSLCPLMPAGQSPSTSLGNSQIGKSGKAIFSKPNLRGTAAQFGSLPNEEWTDRLSNNENHAPNSVNEFGCMKKTKLALCQCKFGSSQTFSIASYPSQSRK
ncbi:hypothetical protein DSO57_1019020 [Entomophthora muscae]|uniref:Uncharacterized protein n=1 Tax=Entomophthora muscae TaxID=34485 RepID=A0ACC2TRR7_9FUNG|nr:hypothetical protein DSO57_1019020 [Entomophthora muscae]